MIESEISIDNIQEKSWFLTGLFITMPFFSLGGINFYNYGLLIYLILGIFKGKFYYHKESFSFILFLIAMFISTVVGYSVVPLVWANYSMVTIVKSSFLLMLIVFVSSESDFTQSRSYFLKGIIYAAFAHLIWILLQYVTFKVGGIDLNLLAFGQATPRQNSGIVLTGLSWERANSVIALVIAIILLKNVFLKVLLMVGVFATASRTGIIMLLAVLCYDIIAFFKKKNRKVEFHISFWKLVTGILVVVFVIYLLTNNTIKQSLNYTLTRFERLFTGGDDYSSSSVDGHVLYYQWLSEVMPKLPLRVILFGCGTNISGWVYSVFFNKVLDNGPWSIECDFVAVLFGNGIIGLVLYYYNFIKLFVKQNSEELRKILLSIFVGTFLYGFLASSLSLILMMFCISPVNRRISNLRKSPKKLMDNVLD